MAFRNDHQAVAFYPVAWRFPEQLADALTPLAYEEWPLVYLETPLLDVLRGTTTMEEQRDAIRRVVRDALELLQHDNALKTLTDEVRHKASSLTEA
ncbi:hypothetical protein [Chromohalobacter israelensis]|uniref:hypothetical protein n=1 Tax=Chromohalobacter israelensis TaxID=141390 RepID=UPI001025BFEF|nr:hypothetical protein [Chromohalobacter salexigens]RXE47619.1 hypothetical protein B4O83_06310 [Chromohalobacter salexigens]